MRRTAGALAAGALAALTLLAPGRAAALDVTEFQAADPLVLQATAADGTAFAVDVLVPVATRTDSAAALGLDEPPPPAGEEYFGLVIGAQPAGTSPQVLVTGSLPIAAVRLQAGGARVAPVWATTGSLTAATYLFLVPATTTAVVLQIAACQVGAEEQASPTAAPKQTTLSIAPATLRLVAPAPTTTTTTASLGNTSTTTVRPVGDRSAAKTRRSPVPLAAKVGAAAGGGGVLVLLFVVPIVIRRRRYARADREGRVVISSPPALPPPVLAADSAPAPPEQALGETAEPALSVGILGALEFTGFRDPRSSPLREILVYLVLHPGRSFTSAELRSAIWVLGRDEPNVQTFRRYVHDLRKILGPDVLLTEGTRYRIAVPIDCDWRRFGEAVAGSDRRAGLEAALGLVRGPPLTGAFEGRNSPFLWALPLVGRIEPAVVAAAMELAALDREAGDLPGADWALAQGLLSSPQETALFEARLEMGWAMGGERELARRLEAARALLGDYPEDVATLEEAARHLRAGVG